MKTCSKCGIAKPLEDFHKNRRQSDGRQTWCKACHKEHQNRKRADSREEYNEYQREWRANHPGYFAKYKKRTKGHGPVVSFGED